MNGKELVQRALKFQKPDRLPVVMRDLGVSDIGGVQIDQAAGFSPALEGTDEWGCIWSKSEVDNMGFITTFPLEEMSGFASHPFPDYTDSSRYLRTAASLDQVEADGQYALCGIFMLLFERMHALHGFENTLVDIIHERESMESLADRITDAQITLVREMARRFPGRVNGWWMTEDWGTQQSAFISMDLWRDFFFPRYKKIFDAMHEAGCDVWVHSCGKTNEIIEGFIQAGVNVMDLQQPRALGIEDIGQRYRGRVAFQSLSDIQTTLPTGEPERIRADARALLTHWATSKGGFILSDYGDGAAIGVTSLETKKIMYQAFSEMSAEVYGESLPPVSSKQEAHHIS